METQIILFFVILLIAGYLIYYKTRSRKQGYSLTGMIFDLNPVQKFPDQSPIVPKDITSLLKWFNEFTAQMPPAYQPYIFNICPDLEDPFMISNYDLTEEAVKVMKDLYVRLQHVDPKSLNSKSSIDRTFGAVCIPKMLRDVGWVSKNSLYTDIPKPTGPTAKIDSGGVGVYDIF